MATDPINALRWRSPDAPERILAIRLQALGDTVLTAAVPAGASKPPPED